MMIARRTGRFWYVATATLVLAAGCGSDDTDHRSGTDFGGAGGAVANSSGGVGTAIGGQSGSLEGSGGSSHPATGGLANSGGVGPSGGAATSGGSSSGTGPTSSGSGGGTGGNQTGPTTGGRSATGGALGSGGTSTAGGQPGTGGRTANTGGADPAGSGGRLGSSGTTGTAWETGGTDAAGGVSTGGNLSGGNGSGGADAPGGAGGSGGEASGGSAGEGGGPSTPAFILGADISSVDQSSATYRDTDGQTKSIFELLKSHGFNTIRLRTFVDPSAPYGYASSANGCAGLAEAYGDKDHVIAFGKQVKAAGMGFLLDFHYSDVWADPGNQIIPEAWRSAGSIEELASLLHDYTFDVLSAAVESGARPDMVQVGNEITPGMLMHVPGANTDCWGNNPSSAPIGGSTSNWDNLATLLNAGIEAVRSVDPGIKVMLHVENTESASSIEWWISSAQSRGVDFDVLGLSCYTAFQGEPSVWENTFTELAATFPDLEFAIAEYNPDRTAANRMMKNLPGGRGLGTFFWEPTQSGEWGDSLFTWQGGTAVANAADFAEFDALLPELGL